jgi:membrane peptidoglycan carboxypeptidase
MVGGRNYDESSFNRAVDAKRQPGSAFKLFVYLAALRSGYSLDDMVDASPLDIGGWRPKNFGGRRHEHVSLSNGFIHSINTGAVRLALNVGLDKVIATAHDLGIDAELTPVPSLALGTIEVSLLDLTGAYASVLDGRAGIQPWGITAFGPAGGPMRALGPPIGPKTPMAHRQEMIELLQAVVDRGTGRAAAISGFAAGKTGTSQDYRNAWFIGFGDQLVVGVWVGNDDHSPMDRVTGGSLPAQIWKAFMRAAQPFISNERLVACGDATSTDGDLQKESDLTLRPVCNPSACDRRYRSFRASDCTYQPYHGPRMLCEMQHPETQSTNDVDSGFEAHASGRSDQLHCNYHRCASRYRSFDPNDCSYQPFGGGPRRICER